jgi:hypothetical protein
VPPSAETSSAPGGIPVIIIIIKIMIIIMITVIIIIMNMLIPVLQDGFWNSFP